IILHYHLTQRDDSAFWRRQRTMDIPDTVAERIALFRDNAHAYQQMEELFRIDSWVQVMLGQRLTPRGHHRFAGMMSDEQLAGALEGVKAQVAAAIAAMPGQQTFLEQYCPADLEKILSGRA